jgi:hypothetical protein
LTTNFLFLGKQCSGFEKETKTNSPDNLRTGKHPCRLFGAFKLSSIERIKALQKTMAIILASFGNYHRIHNSFLESKCPFMVGYLL